MNGKRRKQRTANDGFVPRCVNLFFSSIGGFVPRYENFNAGSGAGAPRCRLRCEQRTANSERRTANGEQRTANGERQAARTTNGRIAIYRFAARYILLCKMRYILLCKMRYISLREMRYEFISLRHGVPRYGFLQLATCNLQLLNTQHSKLNTCVYGNTAEISLITTWSPVSR